MAADAVMKGPSLTPKSTVHQADNIKWPSKQPLRINERAHHKREE
jgi:hypothetical protein